MRAERAAREAMSRQTVLVVDDSAQDIDILKNALQDDYQVKAALNDVTALAIVQSATPPDIILLDIMMSGRDGYELCRLLKEDPATRPIPVIFVTAKISIEDELRGLELGAVDYIIKPFSTPVVQARVRNHLALFDRQRELARKTASVTRELHATQHQLVRRLARAAEYKDNDSGMHVMRMSNYARILGLATGMSEAQAELLMAAASLHDIGKIGIPDTLLNKTGRLNAAEYALTKQHCEIGAQIIGNTDSKLLQLAGVIALSHHERWDGRGYPHALAGEAIPLAARIAAIADSFDALTSHRPYREAWPLDRAVALLQEGAGEHYDAGLVRLFMQNMPKILAIRARFPDECDAPAGCEGEA
jgi:putative two-component system response regulator